MDKAIGKAAKNGAELIEKHGGKMKLKLSVKPNEGFGRAQKMCSEPDADDRPR